MHAAVKYEQQCDMRALTATAFVECVCMRQMKALNDFWCAQKEPLPRGQMGMELVAHVGFFVYLMNLQ